MKTKVAGLVLREGTTKQDEVWRGSPLVKVWNIVGRYKDIPEVIAEILPMVKVV